MSVCIFIAADCELDVKKPSGGEHFVELDIDNGTVFDGIKKALTKSDSVELGKVWLMDYYEYDERPYYKKKQVAVNDLSVEDIREITEADVWGKGNDRPVYYCLKINKCSGK